MTKRAAFRRVLAIALGEAATIKAVDAITGSFAVALLAGVAVALVLWFSYTRPSDGPRDPFAY